MVDASAVLALADRDDPAHAAFAGWLELVDEDLLLSPLAAARADEALRRAGGASVGEAFAADLQSGAYVIRWWADAMAESAAIARDQSCDLVDASLIAVAARARTDRIATARPKTWRRLRTADGAPFEIVPADQRPRPVSLEAA